MNFKDFTNFKNLFEKESLEKKIQEKEAIIQKMVDAESKINEVKKSKEEIEAKTETTLTCPRRNK